MRSKYNNILPEYPDRIIHNNFSLQSFIRNTGVIELKSDY